MNDERIIKLEQLVAKHTRLIHHLFVVTNAASPKKSAGQIDASEHPESEPEAPANTPICAVHNTLMVSVQGKKGPFWSCHQKNSNGSWCNYRPQAAA